MNMQEKAAAFDKLSIIIPSIEVALRTIKELGTTVAQSNYLVSPATTLERIKFIQTALRLRRRRLKIMPRAPFGEPAWDMLLELRLCELRRRAVSVTSLTMASGVPATTALRYIQALVDQGMMLREDDPNDGRRTLLRLAPHAQEALDQFVDEAVAELRH